MNVPRSLRRLVVSLAAALPLAASAPARADRVPESEILDRTEALPRRLEGVDVSEKLGQALPLDAPFRDETGKETTLRTALGGDLPVLLTFNYSNCPMLCSLQLNGFVESLKAMPWTPGREFRVVTIILDPTETPATAAATKQRYVGQLGRPEAAAGWHFLTGPEPAIRSVADAVGFTYGYNEARKEYVHPAAIVLASPEGRVSRYLYGIEYDPRTVRLSLVEAAAGKVGTTVDRLVLFCFHYDEKEGRYSLVARNAMRLGGGLTVIALAIGLGSLWAAEARKKRQTLQESPST